MGGTSAHAEPAAVPGSSRTPSEVVVVVGASVALVVVRRSGRGSRSAPSPPSSAQAASARSTARSTPATLGARRCTWVASRADGGRAGPHVRVAGVAGAGGGPGRALRRAGRRLRERVAGVAAGRRTRGHHAGVAAPPRGRLRPARGLFHLRPVPPGGAGPG